MLNIATGQLALSSGSPYGLGATWDGNGVNFAVFSAHATGMELCLFSDDGRHELRRIAFGERSGDVWHVYVHGLGPGTRYGLRAHGPYTPDEGHRFNSNKLLIDPYARQLAGNVDWSQPVFGYSKSARSGDLSFDNTDSAPHVPKCVVVDPGHAGTVAPRPSTAWADSVIYEMHPRGATMQHPDCPVHLRGRLAALASDRMLDHLCGLGVTAVELLPINAFVDEQFLTGKGLSNYWGYNTIGFFAPEQRYLGDGGIAEFRSMVERFHSAGIEVILDVVFNHTAEGNELGPTLSFRGLDNASYYRLDPADRRRYVNYTGCGNTLNVAHPFVLRMVLDALRYWSEAMRVDGFRFDLATTLGREDDRFDRHGKFLAAIRQDPVLSRVKLIAEPWDVGPDGYQGGGYPAPFAEWNDLFRDTVRQFWRGDPGTASALADRLLGTAGRFDRNGRRTWTSINYVTSHDGFTLEDLVSFTRKHNDANGEAGRDGHHENYSSNCGIEGSTTDVEVLRCRQRRKRNILATVLLSQGTPMLLAGDESGNSQDGNNNAYCQDNPVGWVDWAGLSGPLHRFAQHLLSVRREHPVLRQAHFLHARPRPYDGRPDVKWHDADGGEPAWQDPDLRRLGLELHGAADAPDYNQVAGAAFLVINGADACEFVLPEPDAGMVWHCILDTACEDGVADRPVEVANRMKVDAECVVLLVAREKETR